MKNFLAVVLGALVASIALSQDREQVRRLGGFDRGAAGQVLQIRNWEYKVTDRGGFNPEAFEKKLNDMSKDGWELDQIDHGEGLYIFRRPPQPNLAAVGANPAFAPPPNAPGPGRANELLRGTQTGANPAKPNAP